MKELIIVLSFLILISGAIDTPDDYKIKFLTVVFRHGDRAPLLYGDEGYPNDPYLDYEFYPEGPAQLNNAGKRREFELGEAIRNKYPDFLGEFYKSRDIIAYSTDTDRTKMSLQLVLAGIHPPVQSQKWHDSLNWQPIRTIRTKLNEDTLMIPEECPQFLEEKHRVMGTPRYLSEFLEYAELSRNLTEITGKSMATAEEMYLLWHTLRAESAVGLGLPSWTKDLFPAGQLYDVTLMEYNLRNFNEKLTRMNGGMLLKNITETMMQIVRGTSRTRLQLLSGHENNIDALLRAMAVNKPHIPAYSSAVLMELLQRGIDYYVKVWYYSGIPSNFEEKTIPGCDSPCSLTDFIRLMKYSIPKDTETICIRPAELNDSIDWTQVTSIAELVKRRLNHV